MTKNLRARDETGSLFDSLAFCGFGAGRAEEVAIGVTRAGTPIKALIGASDLDVRSKKKRILFVGGLDGSARTAQAAASWTKLLNASTGNELKDTAFSAIVCGNPDGLANKLTGDNGVGGNPARGYPPTGDAYLSPTNPESHYVWRWIGMHAPDLVIELVEGDQIGWVNSATRPADSLAVALPLNKACNVGSIDARTLSVDAAANVPRELLKQLAAELPGEPKPGSARAVMQQRNRRTPVEVAEQLAKVYGRDLTSVAYIPAVACLDACVWPALRKTNRRCPTCRTLPRYMWNRPSRR